MHDNQRYRRQCTLRIKIWTHDRRVNVSRTFGSYSYRSQTKPIRKTQRTCCPNCRLPTLRGEINGCPTEQSVKLPVCNHRFSVERSLRAATPLPLHHRCFDGITRRYVTCPRNVDIQLGSHVPTKLFS